ncbi:hypothetical protein [Microbacterium sp. HJ5]
MAFPRTLPRRGGALLALAIVLGGVTVPVAAHAEVAASVTVGRAADASPAPALHVGVRQAAVGEQIPVTIVGAEAGTTWEIALASGDTVVGSVTVGDDGTGTTLVALPTDTDPGSLELTATAGDEEISTALSSAGDTTAAAAEEAAAPPATQADPAASASPLIIGGVAAAALAIAAVAVRRRRTT